MELITEVVAKYGQPKLVLKLRDLMRDLNMKPSVCIITYWMHAESQMNKTGRVEQSPKDHQASSSPIEKER